MSFREETTVLTSWKDIARYMGKGVRTVQRWEHQLGLPVRRPTGAQHKSAVLVDRSDLDAWLATRFSSRRALGVLEPANETPSASARAALREKLKAARELRNTNYLLTEQIRESIQLLTARCSLLVDQTVPFSVNGPPPAVAESIVELTFPGFKRIA